MTPFAYYLTCWPHRVLEEGQILDHQRKKWQMQATVSVLNKQARNLSRARSKSLTQKNTKDSVKEQSNFDFLAARSLLGNQNVVPVNTRIDSLGMRTVISQSDSNPGTFGRISHSHSNSLSKTLSKSSKSHSRGHSRNDSWSKRMVKNTAALCGFDSTLR